MKVVFVGGSQDGQQYEVNTWRDIKIPRQVRFDHVGVGQSGLDPAVTAFEYETYEIREHKSTDSSGKLVKHQVASLKELSTADVMGRLLDRYTEPQKKKDREVELDYMARVLLGIRGALISIRGKVADAREVEAIINETDSVREWVDSQILESGK